MRHRSFPPRRSRLTGIAVGLGVLALIGASVSAQAAVGAPAQEEGAELEVTLTSDTEGPIRPGEPVSYAIEMTNHGPATALDSTLTAELPDGMLFEGSNECDADGQVVTCNSGTDLDPGSKISLAFGGYVDPDFTGDEIGDTVARATSSTSRPDGSPNDQTARVALPGGLAEPAADLQITKDSRREQPVRPGQTFVYDVTVSNPGPSTATDVRIADELPEQLSYVSSTGCTPGEEDLDCGTTQRLGEDETRSVRVKVRLDAAYDGDGSDVENVARVTSSTDRTDGSVNNQTATAGLPTGEVAEPAADLRVAAEGDLNEPFWPGETRAHGIGIVNDGPSAARDVQLRAELDPEMSFADVAPHPRMDCEIPNPQRLVCSSKSDAALEPGRAYIEVTVTRSEENNDREELPYSFAVESSAADPDAGNNAKEGAYPAWPAKTDVGIQGSTVGDEQVPPGGTYQYAGTVTNHGHHDDVAAFGVKVTDQVPEGLRVTEASVGQGACDVTPDGDRVTCEIGTMEHDATVDYRFTFELDPSYDGNGDDIRNAASVRSAAIDPVYENDKTDPENGGLPGGSPLPPVAGASQE